MTDPVQPEPQGERLGVPAAQAGLSPSVEPLCVSPPVGASIPNADWLARFVTESNRIEGIDGTTPQHIDAHIALLAAPLTIDNIIAFVGEVQPDARFRNEAHVPGVRVGNHIAPPSGLRIEVALRRVLAIREPWQQHLEYETLHPFTDGNGRSGRAIWLHRHYHERSLDQWACQRGFLHSWYYQTLANVRQAQAIEARRAETQDSVHESAVAESHSPNPPHNPGTPTMDEVTVTDADIRAAEEWCREWKNCFGETTALYEAFARHREQSIAPYREALEKINDLFGDAIQADCESGVRWLNEKAAAEYLKDAPATKQAIEQALEIARTTLQQGAE